jgi:molybdate transport system ATP-binding protein
MPTVDLHERCLHIQLRQPAPIPLDAEFSCGDGELLAPVGPSGKTHYPSSHCGPLPAARRANHVRRGCVVRCCRRNKHPAHRRAVGFVFQSYALFPHMTPLRNVMVALGHRPARERKGMARALLTLVHLQLRGFDSQTTICLTSGSIASILRSSSGASAVLRHAQPCDRIPWQFPA